MTCQLLPPPFVLTATNTKSFPNGVGRSLQEVNCIALMSRWRLRPYSLGHFGGSCSPERVLWGMICGMVLVQGHCFTVLRILCQKYASREKPLRSFHNYDYSKTKEGHLVFSLGSWCAIDYLVDTAPIFCIYRCHFHSNQIEHFSNRIGPSIYFNSRQAWRFWNQTEHLPNQSQSCTH